MAGTARSHGRRLVAATALAAALAAGCSSNGDGAGSTTTAGGEAERAAEVGDGPGTGTAVLVLDGERTEFAIDTCYWGAGIEPSPDLRMHLEGRWEADGEGGDPAHGAAGRTLQVVETEADSGDLIDVIRVRADDGPIGAAIEAQRVLTPATGEVHDLWGEGTTPLWEVSRSGDQLVLRATAVTFGEYPGEGGDARVLGDGDLEVTCVVQGG